MTPYQLLYRIIGLFVLLSVPFTKCKKVHELMTDDEIIHIFQTSRDKVPEYEVVAIEHSLHKRSVPHDFRLNFKAFGKDVQAYLDPIDGILVGENTPVWIAKTNKKQTYYQLLKPGIMKEVLGIYQGRSDRAALVVRSRKGRDLQFHGTIKDLTVIPLPDRVEQELDQIEKRKGNLSRITRELKNKRCHIVFKSKSKKSTSEKNEDTLKQHVTNNSEKAPWTVFPTILVTTDFNIAVESKDDSAYYDQILYQLAFWNGVDLMYRQFDNPKIRLRIAALVIGSDRSATSYLKSNTLNGNLDMLSAFSDMEKYWGAMKRRQRFRLEAFHIVATVTNLEILPIDMSGISVKLAGLARLATICEEFSYTFQQSLILTDHLGFEGISNAAHELAHVLGATHDDTAECLGYLMSSIASPGLNNSKWSACSLDKIRRVLRTRKCVNKPKEYYPSGNRLEKVLPGALKTIHEQCQARGYDWACAATPGICKVLKCYYGGFLGFITSFWMCQDSSSAAEGTECAPGSYCIDEECVLIHKELLEAEDERFLHLYVRMLTMFS